MIKLAFALLFFQLFSFQAQSQPKQCVYDRDTKNVILDVNIVVQGSRIGTYTNQKGCFSIQINDTDTLIFSHVNYHSLTLTGRQVKAISTIYLDKRTLILNEVAVQEHKKRGRAINLGFTKRNLTKRHRITALYFSHLLLIANPHREDGIIKKVRFYFNKGGFPMFKTTIQTKFVRIKVIAYDIVRKHYINKSLVSEDILVDFPSKDGQVEVDVEEYGIIFPNNGAYVGYQIVGVGDTKGNFIPIENIDFKKREGLDIGIAKFLHTEKQYMYSTNDNVLMITPTKSYEQYDVSLIEIRVIF